MWRDARETGAERLARVCVWIGAAAGVVLVASAAWVGDDAYITLRTVDNFWNGYGLRWNAMERVQTYTHPLWLALLAVLYGVTREAYFTTLVLSGLCTLGAVTIAVRRVAQTPAAAVLLLAVLASSRAFVEFSTSGLENPLSHLLSAAFLAEYWTKRRLQWLALLGALCALNRMDAILLVGPCLLQVSWLERSRVAVALGKLAFGSVPLVAWVGFALLYYGSAFPNTAYAKLATGVSERSLLVQGLYYLHDIWRVDPITPLVIVGGLVLGLRRGSEAAAVAVGCIMSVAYTVAVGGDFMRGRFFTPAFFVSALIVCRIARRQSAGRLLLASLCIAIAGMLVPRSPWTAWRPPEREAEYHGILDERAYWYAYTSVIAVLGGQGPAQHPIALEARRTGTFPRVRLFSAVGLMAFHAGPGVHVIDPMALTDPLLARLPARRGAWRIGHFERDIPRGYTETVERCLTLVFPHAAVRPPTISCVDAPERVNLIEDPAIAALYDRLALITQAPLLDRRRLWAIVATPRPAGE